MYFYPRSPCGERPHPIGILVRVVEISIHALLAESDRICPVFNPVVPPISIHALLAESDLGKGYIRESPPLISIHALLAESDLAPEENPTQQRNFYPRSPCGERRHNLNLPSRPIDISIHALLAESDNSPKWNPSKYRDISIHALLAESDVQIGCRSFLNSIFLSTLSLRRATAKPLRMCHTVDISIHALLAESDIDRTIDIIQGR